MGLGQSKENKYLIMNDFFEDLMEGIGDIIGGCAGCAVKIFIALLLIAGLLIWLL